MSSILLVLFGALVTRVSAGGLADVVLSCSLVQEASELGSSFSRTPATLVLRDVPVSSEETLETVTPFTPPSDPDPAAVIFEATVTSPEVPNAEVLLHADCHDLEVVCEISSYSPRGPAGPGGLFFMASINVGDVDFGSTLILRTLSPEDSTLVHSRLDLPLSPSGTLLTEVVFLIFSHLKSVSGRVGGDALLHCGFLQKDQPVRQDVDVEWRRQHRGRGVKVLEVTARSHEEAPASNAEGQRSSVDVSQVMRGNVSLMLSRLKVSDQGTHICSISVAHFYVQQVVQLHISQPPTVSLSEDSVMLSDSSETLSCYSRKYFPLDVQMEWTSLSPTDLEPVVLVDQGSLSSHQQHSDGTFSLTSRLTLRPDVAAGTRIICSVSHSALSAPANVSALVRRSEPKNYLGILAFLLVTGLFFYQVMK